MPGNFINTWMRGASGDREESKLSYWFLLAGGIFGILLIFLIPPFQNPDEPAHTFRVFHLAEGHLQGTQLADRSGGYVPAWLIQLDSSMRYLRNHPEARMHPLEQDWQDHSFRFADFPNVSYYFPVGYLPFVLVARMTEWLGWSGPRVIFLLRITGLILWLMSIFWLMQAVPMGRLLTFVVALLPGTLAVVCSISADVTSLVLVVLWLTLMLRKKAVRSEWLVTVALLFTLQRPNWWPLTLLILLQPQSVRQTWIKMANILIPLLGTMAYVLMIRHEFITYSNYNPAFRDALQINPGVDPQAQLSYVFHDPQFFLHALFDTWLDIFGPVTRHLVGKFGWGANYVSWYGFAAGLFALILAASTNRDRFHRLEKLGFLWIAVAVVLMTSLILYLQWNPVGSTYIHGINGRYLIPILPLLLLAIPWRFHQLPRQNMVVGILMVMALGDLIIQVYVRYYA